ncbi:unnamed protein product [Bursaphelenchus okinawaensis]|uniref:Uncharacterized protein n=1 Tax=Bursaphelenchus okinawaensis TaxID=465554 RepID=A0A811KTA9_9BILA|nr:unnamed protein product [Bursaphelenchus okinawaensis]CAG9112246.1 unnamed protein product [Bursaphelenchus okinawaensis]
MHSTAVLFLCSLALVTGQNLKCYSCEGKCDCRQPREELCPVTTFCYTLRSLADRKVVQRGCTTNCKNVNIFDNVCAMCRGSFCNMEPTDEFVQYSQNDDCVEYDRQKSSQGTLTTPGFTNGVRSGDLTQEMLRQGPEEMVAFNNNHGRQNLEGQSGIGNGAGLNGRQDIGGGSSINNGADIGNGAGVHPNPNVGNGAQYDNRNSRSEDVGGGAALNPRNDAILNRQTEIGNGGNLNNGYGLLNYNNDIGNGGQVGQGGAIGTGVQVNTPGYGPAPSVFDEQNSSISVSSAFTTIFTFIVCKLVL